MATWDDVQQIALSLPETDEGESRGSPMWRVKGKGFVWERPLREPDLKALGDDAPAGPILGAWVPDEGVKHGLIAADPGVFFTTPHFDGYAAVLVSLEAIAVDELEELIVESWLLKAPKRLARSYIETLP